MKGGGGSTRLTMMIVYRVGKKVQHIQNSIHRLCQYCMPLIASGIHKYGLQHSSSVCMYVPAQLVPLPLRAMPVGQTQEKPSARSELNTHR